MNTQGLRTASSSASTAFAAFVVSAVVALLGSDARAQGDVPAAPDVAASVADVAKALAEERYGDAIATCESLADRGVVDAVLSFDRGLAYADRARSGAEVPGDLGRAAHGFEEAKSLSPDGPLAEKATSALAILRGEVARRRAQHGSVTDLDKGASLGRTLTGLLSENGWAIGFAVASVLFGVALYGRGLSRVREIRIAANVAMAVFGPVALVFAAFTLAARHERLHFREGVVVSTQARPAKAPGQAAPNAETLPEAAHVEVGDVDRGHAFVRWGVVEGWIPVSSVRTIARPE
ncbi:MAG: hypothetical protein U0169_02685 [Polyangiaceae bacterium]